MIKLDEPLSGNSEISEQFDLECITKLLENEENRPKEEILAILKNPNARFYFKNHISDYCALNLCVLNQLQEPSELVNYLNDDFIRNMLKGSSQFCNTFIETLLPKLLEIAYRFKDDGVSYFLETIFSSHHQEFDCYFNHLLEKKKCRQKHNVCKLLFNCISSLYSDDLFASFMFKSVFRAFSSAYNDFKLTYKMLIILIEMVGFSLKDSFPLYKFRFQPNELSLSSSLSILNELFEVIVTSKVDLSCEINSIKFNDFVKNILQSVISVSQSSNVHCYKIISKVIEISPLIVESAVNEIIVYAMLNDNKNCALEYEELLVKMFELFSKMHRIEHFVSKMIPTLKTAAKNGRTFDDPIYDFKGNSNLQTDGNESINIDDILPISVMHYFNYCIVNLSSWQVINLFRTVSFHFAKAVDELDENKEAYIYIEILSCLTCWVLLSVRIAEHTVAPNTVRKFVTGLENLKSSLSKFGKVLLHREYNHILMKAFLNICYHWAEIYTTIEYYSFDETIRMEKVVDNNYSACNISYLHPYLSDKEWCLIAERISNFGKTPCKQIMQKLIVQKMRTLVFQDGHREVVEEIIRSFSNEFDPDSVEIFTDKFVVYHILNKIPPSVVISLAEIITRDLFEGKLEIIQRPHIRDCEVLTKAILSVVFTKINKLLKQKRKRDDATPKKALFAKIIATLPTNMLLDEFSDDLLAEAAEILKAENPEQSIDLKMHEDKICEYLSVLTKLPVIFWSKNTQKLILLLLFALHKDNNAQNALKTSCETIILAIVQHNRFTLLDVFDADVLLRMLGDFENCYEFFNVLAQNVFKIDTEIEKFRVGVDFIKDNLKGNRCLRFATTVLNLLKLKKLRVSPDSKKLCMKYKTEILLKIVKIIVKKSEIEDNLLEPFVLALRHFLTNDENETLAKLKSVLPLYVEYCFDKRSDANIRGYLLLFTTILHNKPLQLDFGDDFGLRIWNNMKDVGIRSDIIDEFSELITLIASLTPNEQFGDIVTDLLNVTEEAIDLKNWQSFCHHLKIWTWILSTNFNPTKINKLREQMELLMEKLIFVLKFEDYEEELLNKIIQFEVSIIQANHVPLTAAIVDFLLLNVSILMEKSYFVLVFNSSVSLLENLFKHRNPLILDRLPPFLLQYRLLLRQLCIKSGSNVTLEPHEVQENEDCAHRLEKLTASLVECKRDMGRISMYLVADILGEYELDALDPSVKKHLNNCIYSLIGLCDQHAVQYLMRVLSSASTEMFKIMFKNYKKYYRFTGKV